METTTTRLITIPGYSKLVRLPAAGSPQQFKTLETFHFRGHVWRVRVYVGISSYLTVGVDINDVTRQQSRSASDTKIYIEILDESGEHTVFDKERTLGNDTWFKHLLVNTSELEASSCIRNDSFTIRCTLSLHTKSFFKPTTILEEPKIVLAGSHTLTIDNFSKHKAVLQFQRCARSTRFSIGGSTWYFKLYPNGYFNSVEDFSMLTSLLLTRLSSDEPATTAKFNFELLAGDDGGKYHQSTKEVCTFDHASPEHAQQVPSISTAKHNRIIIRCCLAVIKAEMLMPHSESVLTPSSQRSSCLAVIKVGMSMPCSESVLTPLSRRSSCLATIKAGIKLTIDSFSKHKAVIKAKVSMPRSESLLTPLLGCHDVRSA